MRRTSSADECSPAARHGGWGYSLIEMVMVTATVALLAGVAIPRYGRSLARTRADAAARRVAADLMLARTLARTTSASQAIDFSTPANGYTLAGVADVDRPTLTYSVDLSKSPYSGRLVSAAFAPASGAPVPRVTFDRFGAPSAGGSVVVQVGDAQKTVTLDASSGRTAIR